MKLALHIQCQHPPRGWYCARGFHLDGPCAAVPTWWNRALHKVTGRWF